MPPIAGPMINVVLNSAWLRASAAGSRSCPTIRGIMADRVGKSIPDSPAVTAAAP